jgi:hypothetical protein
MAAGLCDRLVRQASSLRASADGAQCKNDKDSTPGGAVRADGGTVGRVTVTGEADMRSQLLILLTRTARAGRAGCASKAG